MSVIRRTSSLMGFLIAFLQINFALASLVEDDQSQTLFIYAQQSSSVNAHAQDFKLLNSLQFKLENTATYDKLQVSLKSLTPRGLRDLERIAKEKQWVILSGVKDDDNHLIQYLPNVLLKPKSLLAHGQFSFYVRDLSSLVPFYHTDTQILKTKLLPGYYEPSILMQQWKHHTDFEWIELDRMYEIEQRDIPTPNDPYYPEQWYLHTVNNPQISSLANIDIEGAWAITRANNRTLIAVLDSGFDITHEDLAAQFLRDNHNQIIAFDDADTPDAPDNDPFTLDSHHGTACLGLIAATANNQKGMVGVCPECRLLPIRLFHSSLSKEEAQRLFVSGSVVATAFYQAQQQGARVISNSWGPIISPTRPVSVPLPKVIDEAIQSLVTGRYGAQEETLIVWAAGNNAKQVMAYDEWASDPRVFAVGASQANAQLASYSNIGPQVELLAPSSGAGNTRVLSTDVAQSYTSSFGGTSAAAPLVAGVAGLLVSLNPTLKVAQLFEILLDSADPIDTDAAFYGRDGRSCTHGHGQLNARRALALAQLRAADYIQGHTLHYELCGDGVDNDARIETPDNTGACLPCHTTGMQDLPDGVDNDCDGLVDNPVVCQSVGQPVCGACQQDKDCQSGAVCMASLDAYFCFERCSSSWPCRTGYRCENTLCYKEQQGQLLSCQAWHKQACHITHQGVETCDGVDNDCNGVVDDVATTSYEYQMQLSLCQQSQTGVCQTRTARCEQQVWKCINPDTYEPDETRCDGLDNDCDGRIDESICQQDSKSDQKTSCQQSSNTLPAWFILIGFKMLLGKCKKKQ